MERIDNRGLVGSAVAVSGRLNDQHVVRFVEWSRGGSGVLARCVLNKKGITASDIAKMLGVPRATVYRYLTEDRAA